MSEGGGAKGSPPLIDQYLCQSNISYMRYGIPIIFHTGKH